MAQKLLKTQRQKITPKKVGQLPSKKIVLVGTYAGNQLKDWPGYYPYPLSKDDKVDAEYAKNVNEIWLFKGTKEARYFAAECLGVKTREELKALGYPAKGKGHGDGTYLLFKIEKTYAPANASAALAAEVESVIIRTRDFAKRSPKIAKQLKAYLESPNRKDPALANQLPTIVTKLPPQVLRVCEAAVQMNFFVKMYVPLRLSGSKDSINVRFIDLFCGVGGIRLGFDAQGFKCVMSSDINTECQRTYSLNFCETPWGDIQQIDENHIPDHQILCAGFPCQPFSISGKQRGFDDMRGTMFFEICRIIRCKTPTVVFLENVKHLVHHDHGRTLSVILNALEELGYSVSWRVLNATDFGVPQNRERIIIVASKLGVFDFDLIEKKTRTRLVDFLDKDGPFEFLNPTEYTLLDEVKQQEESGLMFAGYRNKSIRKAGVRPGTLHLSRVHKQPNRIYSVLGVHPTLPSQESSGRYFVKLVDGQVRKLTLHECWRIMGFPDEYQKISVPGVQYKQLGNSVCVPMIRAVAKQIKEQFFKGE